VKVPFRALAVVVRVALMVEVLLSVVVLGFIWQVVPAGPPAHEVRSVPVIPEMAVKVTL